MFEGNNLRDKDLKKINELNKKLEQNPNNLELLMEKALIYDEGYDDKNAIKTYKKIIALYPNCVDAFFLLSHYLYRYACEPDNAIKIAKKGLSLHPNAGELYAIIAFAIDFKFGNEKDFLYYLKKSIKLLPNWISPRTDLIEYYIDKKNYPEAKKEITNTLKILEKYPEEKNEDPIKQKISFIARTDRYNNVRKSLKNFSNKIDKLERATN